MQYFGTTLEYCVTIAQNITFHSPSGAVLLYGSLRGEENIVPRDFMTRGLHGQIRKKAYEPIYHPS